MSIPDLVEAFGLASSTLNRQTLNRRTTALLRNGLVERTVDPSGSAVHEFRVTEEGISRLTAERDRTASGLKETLGDWTAERLERFIDELETFNADIERMTGRPWPRAGRATP